MQDRKTIAITFQKYNEISGPLYCGLILLLADLDYPQCHRDGEFANKSYFGLYQDCHIHYIQPVRRKVLSFSPQYKSLSYN